MQVAIVEIEIEPGTPVGLLVPFAIISAILIFVHLLSLMLAIYLLPELESLGGTGHPPELYTYGLVVAKSFSIQFCWVLSNIVGILLFLVELVLIGFIKFYPIDAERSNNIYAAVCMLVTIILLSVFMSPVILYYMRSLSKFKLQLHQEQLNRAQRLLEGIHQHSPTLPFGQDVNMPNERKIRSKSNSPVHYP